MTDKIQKLLALWMLVVPRLAFAEPGVSGGYIPMLWTIALLLSAAAAWLIAKLIAKLSDIKDRGYRWGLTVVLFIVFAVFVAPFFVVIGAILITGRTM